MNTDLPEHLRDPMKVLERGRAIDKVGLRPWTDMDHYERAVRIAEEWWKTDEQRKFLVEIIKIAEQLGGFDHETRWTPHRSDCECDPCCDARSIAEACSLGYDGPMRPASEPGTAQ